MKKPDDILTYDNLGNDIEIVPNKFMLQKSIGINNQYPVGLYRDYENYTVPTDESEVRNCCLMVLEDNKKWRLIRLADNQVVNMRYRKNSLFPDFSE